MNIVKYIAILPLCVSLVGIAQAKPTSAHPSAIFYTIPFHNVQVQDGQKIRANYSFDPSTQVIVCTQTTSEHALESVEWSYKDVGYKAQLPLTLKDNSNFQGQDADPEGMLTITNEFGDPNMPMSVSCEYQKMK